MNNRIAEKVKEAKNQLDDNQERPFKDLLIFGNSKLNKNISNDSVAIFNLGAATYCPSDKLGLCKVSDICYAKKEENRWKQLIPFRKQQQQWWYKHTAEQFVEELRNVLKRTSRRIFALRFNEACDMGSINDLIKMSSIAEMLKEDNIRVYTYTARKDIIERAKQSGLEWSDNLVINGSGFMIDNEFTAVTDIEINKQNHKTTKICPGDCGLCNLCMSKGGLKINVIKH